MKTVVRYCRGMLWLGCMAVFCCCQTPGPPIQPPVVQLPPDLDGYFAPRLPFGGDPRGIYYPNSPLVDITMTGLPPSGYEIIRPTVNSGSGKIILSGSSPIEGTWRTENISFRFDGRLENYHPISTVNHDSLAKFFQYGSGKWGINPNYSTQIVFSNRTGVEDFYYTADSLGMYLYTSPPRISYPPKGVGILCTTIFKKQR